MGKMRISSILTFLTLARGDPKKPQHPTGGGGEIVALTRSEGRFWPSWAVLGDV